MIDRKIKRKKNYIVVTPNDPGEHTPLTCPVCNLMMSTRDDLGSYALWSCCSWCERMWVQGKREKWNDGWRPDPRVVEETLKGLGMM